MQFNKTESVLYKKHAEHPLISDENVNSISKVFVCSPCKYTQTAAQVGSATFNNVFGITKTSVCLQVASGAGNYAR
jgi:hypothetical protein